MKTVLITGGSRGIGRAMVELFSKEGYSVAFTYKNSENEAKSLAEATGALAIRADSASEEEVLRAVKLAFSRGAQTVTTNCAKKLLDEYKGE